MNLHARTVLIAVLALVFGTTAAVGVRRIVRSGREETVGIVVAAQDIPRFASITPDMVKLREFPKSLVPTGAATAVADVVDRVADVHFSPAEPVVDAKLTPQGAGRGMAAAIPKGMRAVTIRTPNVAAGVAGFVLPGNKVDVLFTLRPSSVLNDPTGGGMTRVLVPNVEILAVDQKIEAPADAKAPDKELKSVTLLVTPEQAAEIELAQQAGTLYLALRNPLDRDPPPAGLTTLKGLQHGQGWFKDMTAVTAKADHQPPDAPAVAPAPPPRPAPVPVPEPPPRIRTLRGGIPGQVYIE